MQKIIITGPESSGKTTLAQQVAAHFQVGWVAEYARAYLEKLNRPYKEADLLEIAKGQHEQEQMAWEQAAINQQNYLICDTSFLVLKIWSMVRYQSCHPFIINQLTKQKEARFVLCRPDISWEFDPLREHPTERHRLYQLYLQELKLLEVDFIEVGGTKEARLSEALRFILDER